MTTRHLVISTKSSLPTPDPSSDSDMPYQAIHQNPPRHSYPREILKHRFMPTGSLALTGEEESTITVDSNEMNVDATVSEVPASSLKKISKKTKDEEGSGESKSKKRKGEAASPTKRSKVTKTAS